MFFNRRLFRNALALVFSFFKAVWLCQVYGLGTNASLCKIIILTICMPFLHDIHITAGVHMIAIAIALLRRHPCCRNIRRQCREEMLYYVVLCSNDEEGGVTIWTILWGFNFKYYSPNGWYSIAFIFNILLHTPIHY